MNNAVVGSAVTNISEEILAALAASPEGEAPIAEICKEVSERVLFPAIWPSVEGAKLHRAISIDMSVLNIFSHGFVERPRDGVWRITSAGRQFLSTLRKAEAQTQSPEWKEDGVKDVITRLAREEATDKE